MTVNVSLYMWKAAGDSSTQGLALVWTSQIKRDALALRLNMDSPSLTVTLDSLKALPALKAGWERNARQSGAVIALGLSAL